MCRYFMGSCKPQHPRGDDSVTQLDKFDRLLEAMPKIAESVNSFSSKDVQRSAFDALIAALGVKVHTTATPVVSPNGTTAEPTAEATVVEPVPASEPTGNGSPATTKRPRKSSAKKVFPRVKDINFRPEGKVSLRDYAAAKVPETFDQKNLVLVRYLEEILELPGITVGHVLAAYDECGWRSPAIPDNSLMVTASQKLWLDTADTKAIKTTHSGRNVVQYDMPIVKDKKKA